MHQKGEGDHWTPKHVEDQAVAALRWLEHASGQAGPSGIRSGLPIWSPDIWDFLENGWDLPTMEIPDDLKRPASVAEVARHDFALTWVAIYVQPIDVDMARAANAWLAANARGGSFAKLIKDRGIKRTFAYTLKDRALSIISQRLDARGVPVWLTDQT